MDIFVKTVYPIASGLGQTETCNPDLLFHSTLGHNWRSPAGDDQIRDLLILTQWILPPGLQYDPQFCVWMKWLSFPFPTLLTPPFLRLVAIFNSVVWPVNIIPREGELSSHALAHRFSFDPTKTGKGNRLWTETSYKSSLMCVDESVYMFVFGARLCYRGQGDNSQTCEMSLTCLMKVPSNAARTIRGGTN